MGDKIDGINELPELAPVCTSRSRDVRKSSLGDYCEAEILTKKPLKSKAGASGATAPIFRFFFFSTSAGRGASLLFRLPLSRSSGAFSSFSSSSMMVGSNRDLPKLGAGRDLTAGCFGAGFSTEAVFANDSIVEALLAFLTGASSCSEPDCSAREVVLAAPRPVRPACHPGTEISSHRIRNTAVSYSPSASDDRPLPPHLHRLPMPPCIWTAVCGYAIQSGAQDGGLHQP